MPAVQQSGVAVYDSHTVRRQSLSDLLRILRIRWLSVLVVTLCVLGLGAAAYYLIYSFRGTTIMEINADNPANEGNSDALRTPTDDIQSEVQTDINILEEDNHLPLNVINRLSLMGREPFVRAIFPSESGKDLVDAPKTRDKA